MVLDEPKDDDSVFDVEGYQYIINKDLMEKGLLNRKKVCVTCSCCSELIRAGKPTGCVIRDKTVYTKEYKDHFGKGGRR